MAQALDWIDPFGAQEYFIDAINREFVCPGLIRLSFGTIEHGQVITRGKYLLTEDVFDRERAMTTAFLNAYRQRALVMQ